MNNQITAYQNINDSKGISMLGEAIAQSGMFGASTAAQGVIIALQCMAENKPPLEMAKNYHIVKGKLSKRADSMLADFRRAGGKWVWEDLKNTTVQRAKINFESYKDFLVEYSIDDSKSSGVYNSHKDSPWQKTPAAMMRARLVSETLRAIAPEIVVGVYTPEEADQFEEHLEAKLPEDKYKTTTVNNRGLIPFPSISMPPEPKIKEVEAVTLEELIGDRGDQVTAYYNKKKVISRELGETWKDLPQEDKNRLLADFENFEKAILIGGSK